MMDRRTFLRRFAGAALLSPVAAYAQATSKTRRVGVLMTTTPVAAAHIVAVFSDGLKALGHVEGKNVVIEYRWAEGRPERFAEMAADLVRHKVDVIVASSQAPALAAKRATTTIPIVMINATDPVEAGLVASLARPGGNVTGLSQQLTPEIRAKQLQLLKETLPRLVRVAVLHSPSTTVGLREYETAGQALDLRIQLVEVKTRDDLGRAFVAMVRDRVDAVVVPGDTFLFAERQRVAELAREHRLPGMYSWRELTELCLRLQRDYGVRGWGRDGLGTGARGRGARARRALMLTILRPRSGEEGRWDLDSSAKGLAVALRSRGRARPGRLHRRRTRIQ